jgi:hypothetical protein
MPRSNVDLFLANLRLLNLNSLSDWPSITAQTLSTTDANQSQKARIRAIEWALYRLFEIWDAEETRNVGLSFCGGSSAATDLIATETAAFLPSF